MTKKKKGTCPKAIKVRPIPRLNLIVCTSYKDVEEVEIFFDLEIPGLKHRSPSSDGFSTVIERSDSTGHYFYIILAAMPQYTKRKSYLAALVSHEAYHCACRYFELIGETAPGEEVFAYTIDSIVDGALSYIWNDHRK